MTTSLFGHLAFKFAAHPENVATEALGYILQQSEAARAGVVGVLELCGVDVPGELTYSTQDVGADQERPDLVARTPDGQEPLLIEAKFWAGFTDNQPVTYLGRLPPEGVLLFLVPETRVPTVWHELARRCRDAGSKFEEHECNLVKAHRAVVAGHWHLVIISWRQLLGTIRTQLEGANERQLIEDVSQLNGLCERMDTEGFLPLTSEELTSSIPRRVFQMGKVIDDATDELVRRGVASTKGLRPSAINGRYGRYMRLRGVPVLFACPMWFWVKHHAPLWAYVNACDASGAGQKQAHDAVQKLADHVQIVPSINNDPCVEIRVPVGVERDQVVASVVEQMVRLGGVIAHLAPAKVPDDPPPELPGEEEGSEQP